VQPPHIEFTGRHRIGIFRHDTHVFDALCGKLSDAVNKNDDNWLVTDESNANQTVPPGIYPWTIHHHQAILCSLVDFIVNHYIAFSQLLPVHVCRFMLRSCLANVNLLTQTTNIEDCLYRPLVNVRIIL